jgi:hypothetical protein
LAASTALVLHVLLALLISPVPIKSLCTKAEAAAFLEDVRPLLLLLLLALLALPDEEARGLRTVRVMVVMVRRGCFSFESASGE